MKQASTGKKEPKVKSNTKQTTDEDGGGDSDSDEDKDGNDNRKATNDVDSDSDDDDEKADDDKNEQLPNYDDGNYFGFIDETGNVRY